MKNYDRVMSEMTPEKLTELILDGIANSCHACAYRENRGCDFCCHEGIEKWMNQEEKKP